MSIATIQKIIGEQSLRECMDYVDALVRGWMEDNNIGCWEHVVAPGEFGECNNRSFEVHTGATKVVLIPWDSSYVIKIPYIGEDNWCEGINYFTGGRENEDADGFDYCAQEAELYEKAEEYECAQFLVPEAFLMDVENIPVYIQIKVTGNYRLSKKASAEDIYSYASIHNSELLMPEVGTKLLQFYTVAEIARFLAFIKLYNINDLEATRNGEYVPSFGRYVFWDYSGYMENPY